MAYNHVRMKKNALLLLIAVFQCVMAFSQTLSGGSSTGDLLSRLKNFHDSKSEISVYLDPFIEENYYKHILYNQKDPGVMGYRIRIFRDSGTDAKERANAVRSNFLLKFEEIDAELKYVENIDWVIYVGNCRTRSEVLKLYNKVKIDFPYSFIVSQKISVSDE